ncbi:MAG: hypothetical protein ACRC1Z_08445 [Waterburya sp.]
MLNHCDLEQISLTDCEFQRKSAIAILKRVKALIAIAEPELLI